MAKPVFQVLRSLLDLSRSAFMGEKVFRWSQSASQCATALGSEKFLFAVWTKYKWSVYGLAFMEELFYQILKNRIKWSR